MTEKQFNNIKYLLNMDKKFAEEQEQQLSKRIFDNKEQLASLNKEAEILNQNIQMLDQSIKNFEFYTPDAETEYSA